MRWRNGPHGYGRVSKALHWVTVLALTAQFVVGWSMEADDGAFAAQEARLEQLEDRADDLEGDARDAARAEVDRLQDEQETRSDRAEDEFVRDSLHRPTDPSLPLAHAALGLLVLALGIVRVLWRRHGLPPWAEHLGPAARRISAVTEKVLIGLLFAIPLSGLLLLEVGSNWLGVHVAAHLLFFAAIAVHVGLMLGHARQGQLRRML